MTWAQGHGSWVLRTLSEFALKENSWNAQAFFFVHRLTKHILIHHFFITCVRKEPSQEFCKASRSTMLTVSITLLRLRCSVKRRARVGAVLKRTLFFTITEIPMLKFIEGFILESNTLLLPILHPNRNLQLNNLIKKVLRTTWSTATLTSY